MELNRAEIFQKYENQCMHCTRVTLLQYDYEYTCIACGLKTAKKWLL